MKLSGTEVEIVTNPYHCSSAPIDIDYEDTLTSLLIKGPWNNEILSFINQKNIKGLYLNSAKGFSCDDFGFLAKLPKLELLKIIYPPVDSLSIVGELTSLKSLSLSCHWKDRIDLSALGQLERCFISYDKGAETIFNCRALKYLYIDEFKLKDFHAIGALSKLEYLTIGNSSFNQPNLFRELTQLRKLVLLNCRKLEQLQGVEDLSNLEWLTIDGSRKLSSIRELKSLITLKILQLCDNKEIDTLSPIENLSRLKVLCFFGDTVFKDGNFNVLEALPSLSMTGFSSRRHYTHKPSKPWNWNDYDSKSIAIVKNSKTIVTITKYTIRKIDL